jgi:uncharacterized protein YecE (DUF72 family)
MPAGAPLIRVGTSGWNYPHWRGRFYPQSLPAAAWLRFAAERMDTIEINTTFYRLVRPARFAAWRAEVAPFVATRAFRFAVKGSRFITHMKKLRGVDDSLARFFASGPLLLGDALGPILWQLPPLLRFHPDTLAAFFELLPRTAGAVRQPRGPNLTARAPLRYALEPRHPSFDDPAFHELCRRHDIAVVAADTAGQHVALAAAAGGGAGYFRLHGNRRLYGGSYSDGELAAWADRALGLTNARETYVFFDNDERAFAAFDASRLSDLLDSRRGQDRDRCDGRRERARRDRARRGAGVAVARRAGDHPGR